MITIINDSLEGVKESLGGGVTGFEYRLNCGEGNKGNVGRAAPVDIRKSSFSNGRSNPKKNM